MAVSASRAGSPDHFPHALCVSSVALRPRRVHTVRVLTRSRIDQAVHGAVPVGSVPGKYGPSYGPPGAVAPLAAASVEASPARTARGNLPPAVLLLFAYLAAFTLILAWPLLPVGYVQAAVGGAALAVGLVAVYVAATYGDDE